MGDFAAKGLGLGMGSRVARCALAIALALLAAAPAALAAQPETQRPDEWTVLELHARHGYTVYLFVYPDRHVAVVSTVKGERELRRSSGADYAIATTGIATGRSFDLRIGRLGRFRGRFVADEPPRLGRNRRGCRGRRPISETGQFRGRIRFRGSGGYLRVSARHAEAYRERSFRLRCAHGQAVHIHAYLKTLFDYIRPPTQEYSSRDGTWLRAARPSGRGIAEFVAKHELSGPKATFQAASTEWLPGKVATSRWVEVHGVAGSLFRVSGPADEPRHATARPPGPFTGFGRYFRDARWMRGNLAVKLPGLHVRLGSRQTGAELCVLVPPKLERVCS